MTVSKFCLFYRDSRCLMKGRICDLSCDSTNFYDDDEGRDEEKEETWSGKEDLVWFERMRDASEEGADDT